MPYMTVADLEAALGSAMVLRLLDDDNVGSASPSALAWVLGQAENIVAGKVAKRYPMSVLLANPAALAQVRGFATNVAVEYAYRRKPEFFGRDGTPYKPVYDATMKNLAGVEDGTYRLDAAGDPVAPSGTTGGLETGAPVGGACTIDDPTSFWQGFGIF